MIGLDKIYLGDCYELIKEIPDKSVDLCLCDPPYLLSNKGGGFWSKAEEGNHYNARGTRKGMEKLESIKDGIDVSILDEMCRVMKKINIYVFCSQRQIQGYLEYFVNGKGCNWNLLTWHKTNPIPACGNKYLNDTEFILFFREKGVKVYGSYETKRTFYVSLRNQQDNVKYNHPTCKPLSIVRNLLINSTLGGGVVLDAFCGSGTTAVAAIREGRHFMGFEIDENHYKTACERINEEKQRLF